MAKDTTGRVRQVSGSRFGPGGGRGGPGGGPPMMRGVEKARDFKGAFGKLMNYLAPYKWTILAVIIFAAAATVFTILGPKIMAQATDLLASGLKGMILGSEDSFDFVGIGQVLLLTLVLYAISALFSYIQGWLIAGVSANVSYDLRASIESKINKLPLNYFHTTSQGDVLSRITNDVDTVSSNLNNSITQAVTSVATFVGVLIMMFQINVGLTFIALLTIPVSAIGVAVIVKNSQKYFKGQQKYLGDVNGHIEEMYGGHLVVKAFGGEKRSVEEFNEHNDALYTASWKAQFFSALIHPLMTMIGNIGYVIVCILGALRVSQGTMTIGGIQAFITYMRNLNQPITQIATISNQLQQTVAAAERVFEFLEVEDEPETAPKCFALNNGGEEDATHVRIRGNVMFEHVRFSYNGEDIVIKDFSAKVKEGQVVAIVGPTGAGKTTLVKLLMRFYDLDGGRILVDGHDIADFSRRDIRTEFGMVLQDAWLYNGTIMENIRYGRLDASDEEVIKAARSAQADRFIRTLPDGYDTVINEESSNISQGQKQLLTIARAILSNANIMILDEATSSVDTRTEIQIQRAMANLMKGRTSFIIAHRLSTIRNADLILCLDEGDIVEQGTHDELMAKDGFYKTLYQSQFERPEAV